MRLQPGVRGSAILSEEEVPVYRYALSRDWDVSLALAVWIMLNPSTAAADVDDRTVAGCQAFARLWGLGGIRVVNLFALRSTDPKNLYRHKDPVGPRNDQVISSVVSNPRAQIVMAAWGVHGAFMDRGKAVRATLQAHGVPLHVLGLSKAGHPIHPLYVARSTPPFVWGDAP